MNSPIEHTDYPTGITLLVREANGLRKTLRACNSDTSAGPKRSEELCCFIWIASVSMRIKVFQPVAHERSPTSASYRITTDISPYALRVGFTVILTSCPSAVRNSSSRPTEKFPARLRISVETCGCLMPRISPICACVRPARPSRSCRFAASGEPSATPAPGLVVRDRRKRCRCPASPLSSSWLVPPFLAAPLRQ